MHNKAAQTYNYTTATATHCPYAALTEVAAYRAAKAQLPFLASPASAGMMQDRSVLSLACADDCLPSGACGSGTQVLSLCTQLSDAAKQAQADQQSAHLPQVFATTYSLVRDCQHRGASVSKA